MAIIEPFRALRATPERAAEMADPPYDVVGTAEARELARGRPHSFLHVSKPEIDFPAGTDPHSAAVHARARVNLERLVADGLLLRETTPCFYLYRVQMGEHEQLGLVGAASVDEYRCGRIKQHEHTNPDKVNDRARNADVLDAHTGTLFLTHRTGAVDGELQRLAATDPLLDVTAPDGVRHSIWVVSGKDDIEILRQAFEDMPAIYIADGHHRSAAADLLCRWRAEAIAAGRSVGPADRFLAVSFPDTQVQILPYNRLVATLGGHSPEQLLEALQGAFDVQQSADPVAPVAPGEFGLYVGGSWVRLRLDPALIPDDPLGRLDINMLGAHCLAPLLGITEQRTDPRVDFVGGIRGLGELQRRVDSGEMAAAFSVPATRLADVLSVADAGGVMPTKSTWFEPKLRDGLLLLPLS